MNKLNLKGILKLLKQHEASTNSTERRGLEALLQAKLEDAIEDLFIEDLRISRALGYGFTYTASHKHTNEPFYTKFTYIAHKEAFEINFDGKFIVNIGL